MLKNLTTTQIILIVIVIILLIWIFAKLLSKPRQTTVIVPKQNIQPFSTNNNTIASPKNPTDVAPRSSPQTPLGVLMDTGTSTLYYFYSPQCGHCKRFQPTWQELLTHLQKIPNLHTQAIDVTKSENDNIVFYYNITGCPTLILATPQKNVEYTGNRTTTDIYDFVNTHLNSNGQK